MSAEHSLRGDIQGLRAVAVGLVLLFHVWPDLVPAGYIGVDVFFVISGYLIVGSLVREAERNGRVSLVDFYSRRVRRLMPAATVVLACVFAGMFVWLPQARWEDTLAQIIASALYAENWYLAWESVDYLAADNAPGPVQHFWSLSIEEQFYIVWPVVVLAAAWIGGRSGLAVRPLVGLALAVVFAGSLAASVVLTEADAGRAYFVTHTRAWELALGGLLAVWLPRIGAPNPVRAFICSAGLAAISIGAFTLNTVPFPSYSALVPTLGAVLVILAGDFRIGPFRGLNIAPMRYVGDISYSLYLWHWPLIVFYLASSHHIGVWDGLALIVAAFALSHLSYHFVEQRFRHPRRRQALRPLSYGFTSIAAIVTVAGASYFTMARQMPAEALPSGTASLYPGPAALLENAAVPPGVPLIPHPTQLLRDRAPVYDSGCHQDQKHSEVLTCEFGDPTGKTTVAVVGSSHSVNWLPAMDVLGRKNGWRVRSITKSACSFRSLESQSCNAWHDNVANWLADNPVDVVFIVEHASAATSEEELALVAKRWQRFADLKLPILTIRPIPHLETRPGDCLPDRIGDCVIPRASAVRANTIALAARSVRGVHVIDMTDSICPQDTCGPVVGNLVVYRDTHHLTATYAIALAPYLEQEIARSHARLLPIRAGTFAMPIAAGPRQRATLSCGPTGRSKAFSRAYAVVLKQNRIVLRRGDWKRKKKKYEVWDGMINGSAVIISGKYREGRGDVKTLRFFGEVKGESIVGSGKRGPRSCSLIWPIGAAIARAGQNHPDGDS